MNNVRIDNNLLGILAYIREEVERAETVGEINESLLLLETAMKESKSVSPIQGLPNINVEYTSTEAQFNVATNVPDCLVSTFYDLSEKMNQLQVDDPETFSNASTALHWLANNDKVIS
ncbi:hypothetical protein V5T82_03480 [Magnetovibrio sp. PR-2]|uniref:hypothetical protein n=1 Tax=Magnetovibrio sp. PR-2 TaxID=3120356 RepID=UPI002FCE4226